MEWHYLTLFIYIKNYRDKITAIITQSIKNIDLISPNTSRSN